MIPATMASPAPTVLLKSRVAPMLGFKRFFNARRVLSGVELVHKIIKGQFGLPDSFGTEPFQVWYNVLAA